MAGLDSSSASSSYAIARRGDDDFGGGAAKIAQPLHRRVLKLCLKHVLKFCCRAQPSQFRSLLCNEGTLQCFVPFSRFSYNRSNIFILLISTSSHQYHISSASDVRCVFELHEHALARIFHHYSSLFVAAPPPPPGGGRRMPSSLPTASSSSSADSTFTFANRSAKSNFVAAAAPTSVGVSISLKQFHALLTVRFSTLS
jgi:hypothetical protein